MIIFLLLMISNVAMSAQPHLRLESELESFLKRQIPKSERIEVERLRCRKTPVARAEFTVLSPQHPLGLVSFEARWRVAGELQKSICTAEVRAFAQVAIAETMIRHGESLSAGKVRFETRELSPLVQSGYYTDSAQLDPLTANGNIPAHSIIGYMHVQTPKAVYSGEWVDLILERGPVIIRAKVKALEAGQLKSWIRVENPSSKKVLLAQVVRAGEVKIR